MSDYYDDFYPTPKSLMDKMFDGVKWMYVESVLEPSAGKGDMASYINDKLAEKVSYGQRRNYRGNIDCIEINPELQAVLKSKNFRLVFDNFLQYSTHKKYDLIAMNPPFSTGAKHLLHALQMQKRGGNIISLLNAETIKKPINFDRIQLVELLEKYDASIEYLDNEFGAAYRSTNVEIALVKIDIPKEDDESIIIGELKKAKEAIEFAAENAKEMTNAEMVKAIVSRYNYEADAGIELIREYKRMTPYIKRSFGDKSDDCILHLTISGASNSRVSENDYLKSLRYKYWDQLFNSKNFANKYTHKLLSKVYEDIKNMADYDFSEFNIRQIQIDMTNSIISSMEKGILELFDRMSYKHYYDETSRNVHYYNGWKTNKSYIVGKKVILPINLYYAVSGTSFYWNDAVSDMADIEKTLQYLDGEQSDSSGLMDILREAHEEKKTRNIHCKYFDLNCYMKGTTHIIFTNEGILKKFNLFGSQRKGWLPPSYGKNHYADMDKEEQEVIDSFEGEESYEDIITNSEYYLSGVNPPKLLSGGMIV